MTLMLDSRSRTTFRDPRALFNAVRPHVKECTYNVFESPGSEGDLWERELKLLMRDNVMVRNMAERILDNAIAYTITAMEHPEVHLGVGKVVDVGVHQIILDTPVYFAVCDIYNGGRYKHHAPLIERRTDGLVIRTADFINANGFRADEELWAMDGASCSPCDDKVPDSH
ncbi:hypothetical protein [Streptomyces sp. NBC_01481]|uniref:hypothetical protein n=1 Tax=Streptomyces sp. NBC_01481 TaxID=2975869 RepID=UPI0022548EBA|nr:hypothetical protein [Streptomyces sp. NBC_01481]MCX4582677.1 hypothetical protein [Streptomyces sp. NBC_01481]